MPMVIARFSWPKAILVLLLIALIVGACINIIRQDGLRDIGAWFFIFFSPIFVLFFLSILLALLFHRGRSVWLTDGKLVFVPFGWPTKFTTYLYQIPVENIARLTAEWLYAGGYKPIGIIVHLKSGGFSEIPAHLFSERYDVVMARLNQVLKLPVN